MSEVYQRTAIKEAETSNKQNAHISIAYELTNFALLALMKMGITVLRVTIEGRNPVIEVLQTEACDQLNGLVHATISEPGNRKLIKRANFNHCIVQWVSQQLH